MELAIIGGRVSTKDQADKGYSLPQQIEYGQEYIQKQGYELADVPGYSNVDSIPAQPGIFIEDYTGTVMDRPALNAIRDAVEQYGIKVIVYTKADRLARRRIYPTLLKDEFKKLGARIEYAVDQFDDSPEGRLLENVIEDVAEFEREVILWRMKMGKEGRVKRGKILIADRAPYGYRRGPDGTTLVIDPDEAAIVQRIYREYIEGLTSYAIAQQLNADRIPTYAGPISRERKRGWRDTAILGILTNEVYTGMWYFNKYDHDSKEEVKKYRRQGKKHKKLRPRNEWIGVPIPAIIDQETFDKARERAKHNKAASSRNRQRLYLFSGMLTCGVCKWSYVGGAIRGRYQYYRCRSKLEKDQQKQRMCYMPNYSERALHNAIWPWMSEIMSQPEQALALMQAQAAVRPDQYARLEERRVRVETILADVRKRIANLDDEIEIEEDDENKSALRARKAQRTRERKELEQELTTLRAKLGQQPSSPERRERIMDRCRRIARGMTQMRPAEQRATYEDVDLQVRLEVRDGVRLAHVTCMVGEETFDIDDAVNLGASRC
jgi:site-specific DNA recombinase